MKLQLLIDNRDRYHMFVLASGIFYNFNYLNGTLKSVIYLDPLFPDQHIVL